MLTGFWDLGFYSILFFSILVYKPKLTTKLINSCPGAFEVFPFADANVDVQISLFFGSL